MDHSVEYLFQSMLSVRNSGADPPSKMSTRSKQLIAAFLTAFVVSVGMTWTVLRDGLEPLLSFATTLATMLSLLSLFAIGSAERGYLWRTLSAALVLAVIAPLLAALALNTGSAGFPIWWIGLSALFSLAAIASAIDRHRELDER